MNIHTRGQKELFAIKNTFEAGWLPDSDPHRSPNSSYDFMLNGVNQSRESKGFGVVNEESTFDPKSFPASIVGWSHIDEWNATLVFCSDDSLNLFHHNNNSVQFVCRGSEFGCSWDFSKCEFLYGEFKSFNACNELHVYWSSNCIYHVVNINEMLNPARKAAVIACEDCSYFDIFKVACKPHMSAIAVRNLGSAVEGGAVQFALQLEDNNGNQTNWFDISQPVYLETPDNTVGQIGGGGARLHIDGLDPKFDKVNIAVIKTVGGVTVYEKMKTSYSYGSSGITFDYYGQKGEVIDVATIITRKKAFLRGQDLLQVDGRMFYYNILNERNLNYQKYANRIQVNWVEYEVSLAQQKKFKYPSLMRGEVYAFGIVLCYADGTYSPVFHIPGGGGGGGAGTSNATASGILFSARSRRDRPCFDGEGSPIDCDELRDRNGQPGTGGEGGGGSGQSGSSSDSYSPVMPENLDTEEQFERKRNPSDVKDRPQESDMQEEYTLEDIRKIDTQEDDVIGISECAACTRECWCCDCNDCNEGVTQETQECETVDAQSGETVTQTTCVTTVECAEGKECDCSDFPEAMSNDLPDLSNTHQNNAELLGLYGRDYPDPPLEQTGTLKDAADYLVDNAVINREYITRKKPTLEYGDVGSSGPGGPPEEPKGDTEDVPDTFGQPGVGTNYIKATSGGGKTLRGDNWVDQLGNNLVDEPPRFTGSGAMQTYVSTVQYPDAKDCDGNFFYPQGPVRHNRVPWSSERPHFRSTQNGVENQYQPANDPYGNTFIRLMGAQFTGITRPPDSELPKPLCPNSWYKMVFVQRTHENKSVFAKGWFSGIFTGESYGKTYAFPRHGVNSFEHVDRFVNPDSESHKGAQSNAPMYTFHSPDTDADNSPIPADHVKAEGELNGSGWRYGLYAEGKRPPNSQWDGTRIDNLGARVANNINHLTGGGGEFALSGLGWVEGNTVGEPISGIALPLMNKYRESAWFLQTSGALPGSGLDRSFQGDVIDHFCPTTANAPYGALIRKLPDQYGSVENLQYAELGIKATKAHAGGIGTVEGICGDTFIGPYSKRRTSYISNKVGNFYHVPPKPGSPCRRRSICESPDDKIFEVLGVDHYPTKLPEPGDRWDPRNYCGLHTIGGECGVDGYSRKCREVPMVSETDYYWPRTLKSLVHTIVESHVNPYLLQTGEGSQVTHGRVYYPKLKDLALDSHAPVAHPWEESFMNRFYYAMEQPSIKQIAKKALLRTFIHMGMPALGLTQFQELESVIDGTTMLFTFPMLAALWLVMANTLFTDRRLNQMFRIGDCKRDEEGGDLEERVTNWEDAYARYNWDYSKINYEDPMFAFPLPYNTCDCDDCDKDTGTNNQIYNSNKQNLDSEIDDYRNVGINQYNELSGSVGKLRRLFKEGPALFAHMTDGIYLLKTAEGGFPTSIGAQLTGSGELLMDPVLIFEGPQEGYIGTNHPNASISVGGQGYFFIDDVAKKIYRFRGGQPEEISAYGAELFFKEKLGFCGNKNCYDEKTNYDIHYSMGWDYQYNRLLVTKQDVGGCSSFTASWTPYGPDGKPQWVSLHSYVPQGYIWDRNKLYSVVGNTIWQHHKKGSYGNFYGTQYPFMIQFTATNDKDGLAYRFRQGHLHTVAEIYDGGLFLIDSDKTFDTVAIWNSTQGTGTRLIKVISNNMGQDESQFDKITEDYSKIRYHKEHRLWDFNEPKDLVIRPCTHPKILIQSCDCQVIPDINEGLFDCSTMSSQDNKGRILEDMYLTYRYTFHNQGARLKVFYALTIE